LIITAFRRCERDRAVNIQSTGISHLSIGVSPWSRLVIKVLSFVVGWLKSAEPPKKTQLSDFVCSGSHFDMFIATLITGSRMDSFIGHFAIFRISEKQNEVGPIDK